MILDLGFWILDPGGTRLVQLPPLTPPYTGGGWATLKYCSNFLRSFPLLCKEGLGVVVALALCGRNLKSKI